MSATWSGGTLRPLRRVEAAAFLVLFVVTALAFGWRVDVSTPPPDTPPIQETP